MMLFQPLGQEEPLGEGMATHSSILAWRIHGQRSLVAYSPWGHKESDTAEATGHACMYTYVHCVSISPISSH